MNQELITNNRNNVLAVDVGGTTTTCAVMDSHYRVIESKEIDTDHDIARFSGKVKDIIDKLDPDSQMKVGIAMCGLFSTDGEKILLSPNLGWKNVDVSGLFGPIGREYYAVNDGTAAAWASYVTEAGNRDSRILTLTMGTGIGGGIVLDGNLMIGAGELGHIKVSMDGPKCGCGSSGCLEAFAGGEYMPERAREWFGIEASSSWELYRLAEEGNRDAKEFWKRIGFILGKSIAGLINLMGIQGIFIGGKISMAENLFMEELKKAVRENIMVPDGQDYHISVSKWGKTLSLTGAAAIVVRPPENLKDLKEGR